MATSPIYSWPEPDNTDLVKNGALAIRTLGNAIDTTMGTMVAKTIIDAKGDLIAGTAADTAARLAVGANDTVLTADSTAATGLKWATASGGGTWTTWSPSYTNLTIGNGTVVSRYTQTGKTVTVFWRLTFGSTTSVTGAGPTVSLPATAAYFNNSSVGGFLLNSGVEAFMPLSQITSTTAFTLKVARTDQTYLIDNTISSTVPFTWGTADEMTYQFTYEAA